MSNFVNFNKKIDEYMKKHKLLAAIILIVVFVIFSAGTYILFNSIDNANNISENQLQDEELVEDTSEYEELVIDTTELEEKMEEIINAKH